MKLLVWGLFACVCVYSVLDGLQTYHLFKYGYTETNPIIQFAIIHFGDIPGIMLVKAWSLMLGMVTVAFVVEATNGQNIQKQC